MKKKGNYVIQLITNTSAEGVLYCRAATGVDDSLEKNIGRTKYINNENFFALDFQMANCQEKECLNVQSAICLHCQLYLCVTHVVEHGKNLLKEGDQLCEEINELAEQLNVHLQQVHLARDEAEEKLNLWKKKQIEKLEQKYAEQIQAIQFRKNHFTDLESQLTKRLTEEAIQPLEHMQTRENVSIERLKTVRQAIMKIVEDSEQLDLPLKVSSSSVVVQTTTTNSTSTERNPGANNTRYFVNSSINPSDLLSITANTARINEATTTQTTTSSSSAPPIPKATSTASANATSKPTSAAAASTMPKPTASATATSKPISAAAASVVPKPTTIIPKSTSTAAASTIPKPTITIPKSISTAAAKPVTTATASALPICPPTQSIIKRSSTCPCRNLIAFFHDVSGNSDYNLERFIVKNLGQVVHVNNVMILLLSLLEAWHSSKSPTIINHDILSYHINIVKKYIKGSEHQLTVIAACQVHLIPFKYDDQKSSEMIIGLLEFFLHHQCITKETLLDWNTNGVRYGYAGFDKAKRCAQPLINRLHTNKS